MHIYSFFLFFLLNIFVSFVFIFLFPWHLGLVCFPVCALVSFVLVDTIFGFFCSLGQSIVLFFLLGCFDFAYGCICICVYSVTLFVVVINLCLYVGLLQFCGVFLFFFLFLLPFFLLYDFNFLNLLYFFYIYSFICLSYCSCPLIVNL